MTARELRALVDAELELGLDRPAILERAPGSTRPTAGGSRARTAREQGLET